MSTVVVTIAPTIAVKIFKAIEQWFVHTEDPLRPSILRVPLHGCFAVTILVVIHVSVTSGKPNSYALV